ncbi:hypothetical protein D3C78_1059440 [compost metagenome]
MVEGAPLLWPLEQLVTVTFERANHRFAVAAAGARHGICPLPDNGVGRGRAAVGVFPVLGDELLDEVLTGRAAFQLGRPPDPGFRADHAFHQRRSGLLHQRLGQVRHDDLHAAVEAELIDHAHGLDQVVAEEVEDQHLGFALGGRLQRVVQVLQACAVGRQAAVAVTRLVLGAGAFAQGAFHAAPPGVVASDVEVAPAWLVDGEVFAEYAGAHPRTGAFAKQVAMAGLAGDLVGVGLGGEVQQAVLAGVLARRDDLLAGGAAEQHGDAAGLQAIDVALRGIHARGAVGGFQLERAAEHATLGVDLLDGQQGAAYLLEPLGLVVAGAWVVEADPQGIAAGGRVNAKAEQQQAEADESAHGHLSL